MTGRKGLHRLRLPLLAEKRRQVAILVAQVLGEPVREQEVQPQARLVGTTGDPDHGADLFDLAAEALVLPLVLLEPRVELAAHGPLLRSEVVARVADQEAQAVPECAGFLLGVGGEEQLVAQAVQLAVLPVDLGVAREKVVAELEAVHGGVPVSLTLPEGTATLETRSVRRPLMEGAPMRRCACLLLATLPLEALASEAAAGRWELGLGTRDTVTEPWHIEGLRLIGRRAWSRWAVELDLYATPSTRREWGTEDPWDWDPYREEYVDIDQLSGALLADWGPGYRAGGSRWQIAPHALVGLEARRTIRRWKVSILCTDAGIDYAMVEPSPEWAFGPDLGLGLHLYAGPRVGLRVSAMDRMRVSLEEEWTASDVLSGQRLFVLHDLTAAVDLLLAF